MQQSNGSCDLSGVETMRHEKAGGVGHNHYARYVDNVISTEGGNNAFGAAGRVKLFFIQVPFDMTIDMLGYGVGPVAAGNIRMGLYETGSFGFPDLPDAGNVVVETASLAQPGIHRLHWCDIVNTFLAAGLYFGALQGDDITGTYYYQHRHGSSWHHNVHGLVQPGRMFNQGYGAFTNPCPVTGGNTVASLQFYMRIHSVP